MGLERPNLLPPAIGYLADWTYLPVIESGAGQVIQWGTSFSADHSFMRLRYSSIPTSDPFAADFDGDGVSNYDELLQGTDPLSWHDGDGTHAPNGLPDDWELYHFGMVGVDPSADPDSDGRTNLQEYQTRSDPNDYYNGVVPLLAKVSGDGQNGYTNGGTTITPAILAPIKVRVTDAITGVAIPGASINFVPTGSAGVRVATSADPGAVWQATVNVCADATGPASAWVKMPAAVPPVDQDIEASAASAAAVQFVNDLGQAVGAMVEGMGTTQVEDLTKPYVNGNTITRLFVWPGGASAR